MLWPFTGETALGFPCCWTGWEAPTATEGELEAIAGALTCFLVALA